MPAQNHSTSRGVAKATRIARAHMGSMAGNISRLIAEGTRDGATLVEFALQVHTDPTYSLDDRKWAQEWLTERLAGKAPASIEVHASSSGMLTPGATRPVLEDYDDEAITKLDEIQRIATAKRIIAATSDEKKP